MQRIFTKTKFFVQYSVESHNLRQNVYQIQQNIASWNLPNATKLITEQRDALNRPDQKRKFDKIFYEVLDAKIDFLNQKYDLAAKKYEAIIDLYKKNETALKIEREYELGEYGNLVDLQNTLDYIKYFSKCVSGLQLTSNELKEIGIKPSADPLHVTMKKSRETLETSIFNLLSAKTNESGRKDDLLKFLLNVGRESDAIAVQRAHVAKSAKLNGVKSLEYARDVVPLIYMIDSFPEMEQFATQIIPTLAHSIRPSDKSLLHDLFKFLSNERGSISHQTSINLIAAARGLSEISSVQWLKDTFELMLLVTSNEDENKSVSKTRSEILQNLMNEVIKECKTPSEHERNLVDLIESVFQMSTQNFNAAFIKLAHLSEKTMPELPLIQFFKAWCQYNRGNTKIAVDALEELTKNEMVSFKAINALHFIKMKENSQLTDEERTKVLQTVFNENEAVERALVDLDSKGTSPILNSNAYEDFYVVESAIYKERTKPVITKPEVQVKAPPSKVYTRQIEKKPDSYDPKSRSDVKAPPMQTPPIGWVKTYQPRGQYTKQPEFTKGPSNFSGRENGYKSLKVNEK
jgi:hypothetical protein